MQPPANRPLLNIRTRQSAHVRRPCRLPISSVAEGVARVRSHFGVVRGCATIREKTGNVSTMRRVPRGGGEEQNEGRMKASSL